MREPIRRRLDEHYLIHDARYEKVREDGVICSRAVPVAIGINWEGRRYVLAVELANRESQSNWKDFLVWLRKRGLSGVGVHCLVRPRGAQEGDRRGVAGSGLVAEACPRLVRALCVETHEGWLEDSCNLEMGQLAEQKRELMNRATWAAAISGRVRRFGLRPSQQTRPETGSAEDPVAYLPNLTDTAEHSFRSIIGRIVWGKRADF